MLLDHHDAMRAQPCRDLRGRSGIVRQTVDCDAVSHEATAKSRPLSARDRASRSTASPER